MGNTTSPRRSKSRVRIQKETHVITPWQLPEEAKKQFQTELKGTQKKISCVHIKESDRSHITVRMSPESRRISADTKWSENGFIPSFTVTDRILIKAARRTYKTLGILADG